MIRFDQFPIIYITLDWRSQVRVPEALASVTSQVGMGFPLKKLILTNCAITLWLLPLWMSRVQGSSLCYYHQQPILLMKGKSWKQIYWIKEYKNKLHKCVLCDVYPPICMPNHQKYEHTNNHNCSEGNGHPALWSFFFSFTIAETILSVTQTDCTV